MTSLSSLLRRPFSIAVCLLALSLAACGNDRPKPPSPGVKTFVTASAVGRGAFADEPRAAFIGTEVLKNGGTAVDATTAMYFALTATLPSAVGFTGGGSCVVSNIITGETEIIDFPLRAAAAGDNGSAEGMPGVPAALRGMLLLHLRHGDQKMSELIIPVERMARFGFQVSKAFADDLAAGGRTLLSDPSARGLFLRGDGKMLQPGNQMVLPDYANTLRDLRAVLSNAGRLSLLLSEMDQATASLLPTGTSLQQSRPVTRPVSGVPVPGRGFSTNSAIITATSEHDAAMASAALAFLTEGRSAGSASSSERPHLIADAMAAADFFIQENGPLIPSPAEADDAMAAYQPNAQRFTQRPLSRLGGPRRSPGAAVFGAIAKDSQNVICTMTMGAPFGVGKFVPGKGYLLSQAPASPETPGWESRPVAAGGLIFNPASDALFTLIGSSGGPGAIPAMVDVTSHILGGDTASQAVRKPRIIPGPTASDLAIEEGHPEETIQYLQSLAYSLRRTGDFARVSAYVCEGGLRLSEADCTASADPRGSGAMLGGN